MSDLVVVEPALFASLDPPRLRGGRCAGCATVVFPSAGSCPRCSSPEMHAHPLPDTGEVWSWTVQTFPPKAAVLPAGGFIPFAVGYVDLGAVLVESRLLVEPDRLAIGLPVRLVVEHLWDRPDGPVHGHAFAEVAA